MACMIIPERKDIYTLRGGYCAKKNAKKRMVATTVSSKAKKLQSEKGRAVTTSTLTDPIKPKRMMEAVAASKKY